MSPTTPVKLTVTDWLAAGDLFQVYNFNNLLGTGSAITISGAFAATPDLALGDSRFSQNSWILQPGNYSLIFKSTQLAPTYSNSTVAFKAESLRVPEGGNTLLLLSAALAGIAGLRIFRSSEMMGAAKI